MGRKLKKMPIIPPKDGEIERHSAYHRLNPQGHEEFVIKRNGKEEETLNELASDIDDILEGIEFGTMDSMSPEQPFFDRCQNKPQSNQYVAGSGDSIRASQDTITNMNGSTPLAADGPEISMAKSKLKTNTTTGRSPNKYIAGSAGSEIGNNLVQRESFTGTAGIAISPVGYSVLGDKEDEEEDTEEQSKTMSEFNMKSIDKLLVEWEPEFKAGEYSPGDHKMASPKGEGVASKNAKKEKTGSHPSDMELVGDAWPRKHNETVAMCDVEESGVEDKPQGSHESSVGEPSDGHTSKVSHNWPDKPKHGGGGVAEPMAGDRYSDGGVLHGSESEAAMEWSPKKIGSLLGEDHDLQSLFDSYARDYQQVTLEGFKELCDAHGFSTVLDTRSLLNLMESNKEFVFHEFSDAEGSFWLSEPMTISEKRNLSQPTMRSKQTCKNCKCSPCTCEGGCMEESAISEMQIRTPEEEADIYVDDLPPGDPHEFGGDSDVVGMDDDYAEMESEADEFEHEHGGGRLGGEDVMCICPGCSYEGLEEECPECGQMMISGESELPDYHGSDEGDIDHEHMPIGMEESLSRFMAKAKHILENNRNAKRSAIANALTECWQNSASHVDLNMVPQKAYDTLVTMMKKFPGFDPISECDAMDRPEGKAITEKDAKVSPDLAKQPSVDEMETHGSKESLLKRTQKNTYDTTPIMKGTEKGLTGTGTIKAESRISGRNANTLKENADKLTRKLKNVVRESSNRLNGKHSISFNVIVKEGIYKNRTPRRTQLVETVADLEEILQFHNPEDVSVEANFKNLKGEVVMKADVPLATIHSHARGPIVSEGKMLFRFLRNAELFAEALNEKGVACKIIPHNWGTAVVANTNIDVANHAYRSITR